MPNSIFLDSNIILYAFQNEPKKQNIARSLMNQELSVISNQVVAEVCYNLIKKSNYSNEEVEGVTNALYYSFKVVSNDKSTFIKAIDIRKKYSFSFWDSLIVASAIENDIECLYSEDMQSGFKCEGMEIINPFL